MWVAHAAALWPLIFAPFHIIMIQTAYLLTVGRFSFAAMGIWEPWFYLGAILFGVSVWRRGQRPQY
jgi:hypothetical protein